MAILAGFFRMCPCKVVTGKVMVKCILIKPDNLKIQSMVIAVAVYTILAFHFCRNMISFILIHPGFYFFMTVEAFCIRNLSSQCMAIGAIGHSFEMGMHAGQWPG
jgi:hypothetical protein